MQILLKISIIYLVVLTSIFPQGRMELEINSANGEENWKANSVQSITWQSSGISKIKIEYSINAGLQWRVITPSVDAAVGQYSWKIPNVQVSQVLIRISDASNPSIYDINDKEFSIYISKRTEVQKKSRLNKTIQAISTPIKIMPFGDSITWGVNPDDSTSPGYRRPLDSLLNFAGYNFDFVGEEISGLPNDFDRDHEGHPGWYALRNSNSSKSFTHHIGDFLDANPPDIVLLHIGTNDISSLLENRTATQIADIVVGLLDSIYSYKPDAITIIAKIVDRADVFAFHKETINFNDTLELKINLLPAAQRSKIKIVDMYGALGDYYNNHSNSNFTYKAGDNVNLLHPNTTGYQKMSEIWYSALQDILPVLQLKVFLEGPYDANGDTMTTALRNVDNGSQIIDLLPNTSPYQDFNNNSKYLNDSTNRIEFPFSIPANITDWIQLEVRTNETDVIQSKSCFLRNDGQIIDPDGMTKNIYLNVPPGNYYVAVRHHNHLSLITGSPIQLSGINSLDFTTDSTQSFGNMALKVLGNGKFGMIAGDNNNDDVISIGDYNNIAQHMSETGYFVTDDNMDGIISNADYNLVSDNLFRYSYVK